jgi:sporulation protein YlmC with PRC-barrel domain
VQRSLNEVYRTGVYTAKGKRVGRVVHVLFDAARPVVVGYLVERRRLLWLFDRKDRHLAHDRVRFTSEGMHIVQDGAVWDRKAASRLGIDWNLTVVWSGMPVRAEKGTRIGTVRDGVYDVETGELKALGLTGGITADLALGTTDLPAGLVMGFTDGYVVISDEALDIAPSGGAAEAAGKGAAVARVQAEKAATVAGDAAKTAMAYGKSAAKVAARSETGKKAVGWLKSVRDEIVDAMGDPEDDD